MKGREAILKYALLVAFGVLVAVGLLEAALRIAGWGFLRVREGPGVYQTVAADGTYRVLCLGESTTASMTFGGKESYPARLERILNERSEQHRFVVINGGVPATTTDLIVNSLQGALQKHRPDIVVTMMGINDGTLVDPLFPASSSSPSLRVWKLARLLYHSLLGSHFDDSSTQPAPERTAPPRVQPISRSDGKHLLRVPDLTMLKLSVAAGMILEERYDEAETMLRSLADGSIEGDFRSVTTVANGQLALLNYQRGRNESASRYHQRFRELADLRHNPKTTVNYNILRRLVTAWGLPLVAVQYPGRSVAPLRHVLRGEGGVFFVDNEDTFLEAVKSRPLKEVYLDLFAGVFGHLTPYGNELLATNVADTILELIDHSTSIHPP